MPDGEIRPLYAFDPDENEELNVPFQREALEAIIEKIRVQLNMHVSPEVLADADIGLRADSIAGHVMAKFELWLYSNTIHRETEKTEVPATWWDGFKQAVFPRWLKRRFPVREQDIFTEIKFVHVCPHLKYRTPRDERFHLQFLLPEGDATEYLS